MLPADLQAAELQALESLGSALAADPRGRWTLELRFEGLRLLPVVLRLARKLGEDRDLRLLFADAGAAALAKRDGADLAGGIGSFGEQLRRQAEGPSEGLLLLVGASQAEYEEVERLCGNHRGAVVSINPALEDAAVGIGSVARERRRGFLATWEAAYALIPRPAAALRRAHPRDWEIYRCDPDGYRLAACFPRKPDREQLEEVLSTGGRPGLAQGLKAIDQLIEGLQN